MIYFTVDKKFSINNLILKIYIFFLLLFDFISKVYWIIQQIINYENFFNLVTKL